MSVLNNADDVFLGSTEVDSVYLGENLVWYRGASIEVINNSGSTIHRLQTGETLNLSTTVASGYVFDTWTLTGGGSLSNATSQNGAVYTSDGTDATITATYSQVYTLNIDNNGNTSSTSYNTSDVVNLPAMNLSSGYTGTWAITQGSGTIDTSANPMTFTHSGGSVVEITLNVTVSSGYNELEFEFALITEGNEDPVTLADPANLYIGNTAIQNWLNAPTTPTGLNSQWASLFNSPYTEGIGVFVHECNGQVSSGTFNSWDQFGTGACTRKAGYSSELNSTYVATNKKVYPANSKLIFEPTQYVATQARSEGDLSITGNPHFCLIRYEVLEGDQQDWVESSYQTYGQPIRTGECFRHGMFTLSQNTKIRVTLGVSNAPVNFEDNRVGNSGESYDKTLPGIPAMNYNDLLYEFNDNIVGHDANSVCHPLQAWTIGVPFKMSVCSQQYHNKLSFNNWRTGYVGSLDLQKPISGYSVYDSTAYFVSTVTHANNIFSLGTQQGWMPYDVHPSFAPSAFRTITNHHKTPMWPLHRLDPLYTWDQWQSLTDMEEPIAGRFGIQAGVAENVVRLVLVDTSQPSSGGSWRIDGSFYGYTLPASGSTNCTGFPEIGPNGTWSHLTDNSSDYNSLNGMEASFPLSTVMHKQRTLLYDFEGKEHHPNNPHTVSSHSFDPPQMKVRHRYRAFIYLSEGDSITITHQPSTLASASADQDIDEWILVEDGSDSQTDVIHQCHLEPYGGRRELETVYADHEHNLLNTWITNATTSSCTITVPNNYSPLNTSSYYNTYSATIPDIYLFGKNDTNYSLDGVYKRVIVNLTLPGSYQPSDVINSISISATGGNTTPKYKVVTRPTGVTVAGSDSNTTEGNSLTLDCAVTATVTVGFSTYTDFTVDGFDSTTTTSEITWSSQGDGFISNANAVSTFAWSDYKPSETTPLTTETKTLSYSVDVYNIPSRNKGELMFVEGFFDQSANSSYACNPFRIAGTQGSYSTGGIGGFGVVRRATRRPNLIHTDGSPDVALPFSGITQFSTSTGRLAYIGTDGYIYVGGTNVPWINPDGYNGTNPSTKDNYDQHDGPLQYELGKHWNSQSTHPYNITDSIPSMLGLTPDDNSSTLVDFNWRNYNSNYPTNTNFISDLYEDHRIQGYSIRKTNFQGSYVEIGDGCIFYIANNGDLYSAGNNTANGILGRGQFDGHQTVGKVGTVSNVTKVKVSKDSPIARTSLYTSNQSLRGCVACLQTNGNLYWWGENDPQKIINSTTDRYNTPQLITSGVDDFDLTPWNLVVLKSGKLYVYGDDFWDVRCDRTSNSDSLPNSSAGRATRVVRYVDSPDNINTNYNELTNVAHFALGHHCLIAITTSGAVYAGGRYGAEGQGSASSVTGTKLGATVQGEVNGAMRFLFNIPSGKTVRSLKACRHKIYINYTDDTLYKLGTSSFAEYDLKTESNSDQESHNWQASNVKDFELGWETMVFAGQTYDFTNAL